MLECYIALSATGESHRPAAMRSPAQSKALQRYVEDSSILLCFLVAVIQQTRDAKPHKFVNCQLGEAVALRRCNKRLVDMEDTKLNQLIQCYVRILCLRCLR